MSSYIVDQMTVHRIITHIGLSLGAFDHVYRKLQELGYDFSGKTFLDTLGADLVALNYRATNQRYNKKDLPTPYKPRFVPASAVQVLKSLQCLIYQCSEGDVTESKLFQWLESYEHSLMRNIIHATPQYKAAAWG